MERNGIDYRVYRNRLENLVFPEDLYCICCGNIIDETRTYHLCDHCVTHIKWNLDPLTILPEKGQSRDKNENRNLDPWRIPEGPQGGLKMLKCVEYGIYSRSLIFALKYDDHRYIARTIGQIMYDRLKAANLLNYLRDGAIVPVPLHSNKLIERGFNQAELIGEELVDLAGTKGIESLELVDALERVRETRPMRGLGPYEREYNISGAIGLKPEEAKLLRNKKNILIDDFCTTGSTARECARVLKEAHPRDILFISFAAR